MEKLFAYFAASAVPQCQNHPLYRAPDTATCVVNS